MRSRRWTYIAAIAAMLVVPAAAQAQVVTFFDINDATPAKFFDPAASAPDSADANTLVIGFHSGMDWSTYKATDFRASTASFSHTAAMDTISFKVAAPEGFYISRITYLQRGSGSVLRTGKTSGGGSWVVGHFAEDLGLFSTNPTLTRTVDLTGLKLTLVPVSISQSLFAWAPPSLGSATVSLSQAAVQVEVLPLTPEQ
jgi:hypothetical protein